MARTFVAASSQYIDLGNVYDATVDFSVALWVTRNAAGARHDLISKEMASADGWVLTIQFSDLVAWGVFNGGFPIVESTSTIGSGTTAHLLGVRDDAAGLLRMFFNGTEEATASAGGAPTASSDSLNIGRRPSGGGLNYADATIAELAIWDAALNASEAAMLAKGICPLLVRPQSLLAYLPLYGRFSGEPDLVGGITGTVTGATVADHPRIYRPSQSMVAVPAAGGGGTSISPGAAQLSLSGTAPSRFVQHLLMPAAAALLLSTAAPAVTVSANVSPDAAQLSLSTVAPSVLHDYRPSPSTGQLVLSTTAPTRLIAHLISPASGQLTLSSTAPASVQDHRQAPDAAQLILSTSAPTGVIAHLITPTTGALTFSGTAPGAVQDHRPAVAAGQLTLTTAAPSLGNDINISPDVGQLTLSATAPTRLVEHLLSPASGDLVLTGTAPTATQDHRPAPAAANLTFSAGAPTVTTDHRPAIGTGALTLTTTAPSVYQEHVASPAAGQLVLSGFAPVIGTPIVYEFLNWTNVTVTFAGPSSATVRAASLTNVTVEPTE